ncbi:hypothetical protein Y1Q_0018902 [Alligator mississippiensis]|uniref:Uncharacterized protein n=1 Tax=Alligator mississippiensis TaxID=8496 RepID=A0A151M364_ALLMI|nr:hypothetical protein Y1Q_0018902 [Alligator mississippiensis]
MLARLRMGKLLLLQPQEAPRILGNNPGLLIFQLEVSTIVDQKSQILEEMWKKKTSEDTDELGIHRNMNTED